MATINFNAEEIEPQSDFSPLPVGNYTVVITQSEMKPTKTGNGQYLQLTLQVVEGEYKNRLIFDRLNIQNQNSVAQQIAQKALSSICRAVGVMHPKDSEELHDKPFSVKIGIRPASGEYGESNIVKGYSSLSSSTPVKKGNGKKPWEA